MPATRLRTALTLGLLAAGSLALAHGDVAPQPMNTDALPDLTEEWALENPYRSMDIEVFRKAIEIGDSGYNQNCARCHGLGGISGGLAPDLRFLAAEDYDDEWYLERFREGYTQNGITKMPAFGDLLGEKAAWAIRSYLETRPDDAQVTAAAAELTALRDRLAALAEDTGAEDMATIKADLEAIAATFESLSGSDYVDSVAARAALMLDGSAEAYHQAAETVTVGLSAAH